MFTYLWNDIYENLVVKSVGLNLLNFLGSSFSSSVEASSFGCVVVLSLYLTLDFVISSIIVGTFKSVCKNLLDIYHAAFTIARRTLFWHICNIEVFELLAVRQRGIPYVQNTYLNTTPRKKSGRMHRTFRETDASWQMISFSRRVLLCAFLIQFSILIQLLLFWLYDMQFGLQRFVGKFTCSSSAKQETDNPSSLEGTKNTHVKY
jgi:hypothetical protein